MKYWFLHIMFTFLILFPLCFTSLTMETGGRPAEKKREQQELTMNPLFIFK